MVSLPVVYDSAGTWGIVDPALAYSASGPGRIESPEFPMTFTADRTWWVVAPCLLNGDGADGAEGN